jgi:hypothetical protein
MMPRTYEPIASTTLGTASGTISFDSIAATWTDLVLVLNFGVATAGPTIRLRFNDDTGSNYSYTYLGGNGTSASSSRQSSQTSGSIGLNVAGAATGTENVVVAHIMSYANTNVFKTVLGAGAAASREADRVVSLWRSTSAITKVTVSPGGSFPTYNFNSGATASLFGVKAA